MSTVHVLRSAEEIAARAGAQFPFLLLPQRADVFANRARRLRKLAHGHAMGGYLEFVALIADQQQDVLVRMPPIALPNRERISQSRENRFPPLECSTHLRDPAWRDVLRQVMRGVAPQAPGPARQVIERLDEADDDFIEAQAGKLLTGVTVGLDTAAAPLIGAGLQTYFSHLVLSLGEAAFGPIDPPSLCPCCGSRPTASVVRIGGEANGLRYLQCSLCSSQWHMVRIKCARCQSTKGIGYCGLDDGSVDARKAVVLAETCEECGSYTKVCHMDRDLDVEPCADDLATLPLDLLVAEEGHVPWGVNFMLIHGDPGDVPERPVMMED